MSIKGKTVWVVWIDWYLRVEESPIVGVYADENKARNITCSTQEELEAKGFISEEDFNVYFEATSIL